MNHDAEAKKYMRQRYEDFMENIDDRPYWQWVGIEDPSLCSICATLNKKVFRYDETIWQLMLRRLHKGCRCRFRALSERNMQERNLDISSSIEIIKQFTLMEKEG